MHPSYPKEIFRMRVFGSISLRDSKAKNVTNNDINRSIMTKKYQKFRCFDYCSMLGSIPLLYE
jgi:hypothetical protein